MELLVCVLSLPYAVAHACHSTTPEAADHPLHEATKNACSLAHPAVMLTFKAFIWQIKHMLGQDMEWEWLLSEIATAVLPVLLDDCIPVAHVRKLCNSSCW
jgi:hypothetical protein